MQGGVSQISNVEMAYCWEKIAKMPYFLDDSIRDPYSFETVIKSPATHAFLMGNPAKALLYAHSITPGFQAGIAIAIWSHSAKARYEQIRQLMQAVCKADNLHRLYSLVAAPNTAAHHLHMRIGMKKDGEIKEGVCYDGQWLNAIIYGTLARDI